jgi:hypothetical protein
VKIRRSTPRGNVLVAASKIVPEAASQLRGDARRMKRAAIASTERQINGDKMRKTVLAILGALLIAGSAVQMATPSEQHARNAYRGPAAASEFRDANNSVEGGAKNFCSCNQEPGNPYNEQADYIEWSAFRNSGAWDSRNDCQ